MFDQSYCCGGLNQQGLRSIFLSLVLIIVSVNSLLPNRRDSRPRNYPTITTQFGYYITFPRLIRSSLRSSLFPPSFCLFLSLFRARRHDLQHNRFSTLHSLVVYLFTQPIMLTNASRILLVATAAFSAFRSVSGHGAVVKVTIDGKEYTGPLPGAAKMDSIIREVTQNGPVTDVTSKDLWCGVGSTPATEVASAKPGSNLNLFVSKNTFLTLAISRCQYPKTHFPFVVEEFIHVQLDSLRRADYDLHDPLRKC